MNDLILNRLIAQGIACRQIAEKCKKKGKLFAALRAVGKPSHHGKRAVGIEIITTSGKRVAGRCLEACK